MNSTRKGKEQSNKSHDHEVRMHPGVGVPGGGIGKRGSGWLGGGVGRVFRLGELGAFGAGGYWV